MEMLGRLKREPANKTSRETRQAAAPSAAMFRVLKNWACVKTCVERAAMVIIAASWYADEEEQQQSSKR